MLRFTSCGTLWHWATYADRLNYQGKQSRKRKTRNKWKRGSRHFNNLFCWQLWGLPMGALGYEYAAAARFKTVESFEGLFDSFHSKSRIGSYWCIPIISSEIDADRKKNTNSCIGAMEILSTNLLNLSPNGLCVDGKTSSYLRITMGQNVAWYGTPPVAWYENWEASVSKNLWIFLSLYLTKRGIRRKNNSYHEDVGCRGKRIYSVDDPVPIFRDFGRMSWWKSWKLSVGLPETLFKRSLYRFS